MATHSGGSRWHTHGIYLDVVSGQRRDSLAPLGPSRMRRPRMVSPCHSRTCAAALRQSVHRLRPPFRSSAKRRTSRSTTPRSGPSGPPLGGAVGSARSRSPAARTRSASVPAAPAAPAARSRRAPRLRCPVSMCPCSWSRFTAGIRWTVCGLTSTATSRASWRSTSWWLARCSRVLSSRLGSTHSSCRSASASSGGCPPITGWRRSPSVAPASAPPCLSGLATFGPAALYLPWLGWSPARMVVCGWTSFPFQHSCSALRYDTRKKDLDDFNQDDATAGRFTTLIQESLRRSAPRTAGTAVGRSRQGTQGARLIVTCRTAKTSKHCGPLPRASCRTSPPGPSARPSPWIRPSALHPSHIKEALRAATSDHPTRTLADVVQVMLQGNVPSAAPSPHCSQETTNAIQLLLRAIDFQRDSQEVLRQGRVLH